ncbi:MAG: hypothetical protein NZ958_02910 [Bacteroidia bacterium]|nr:hypothetical protein [Bacteroidia bacterium]MDW8089630.1 hypothetical protein [Bacteroidia bacterium]
MENPKSDKKKKKRTLVIIDGDALQEGAKYDFSFLENEKRLEIWFFYKQKIHHSFQLRREFSAHNIVLPRYEEDLHLYLLKRVCFELGRRYERYRKVIFIGGHHFIWEGLVQFLRERDLSCTHLLAEDYRTPDSPKRDEKSKEEELLVRLAESLEELAPGTSLTREEFIEWVSRRKLVPRRRLSDTVVDNLLEYLRSKNRITIEDERIVILAPV